ncbi:hypothetical protein HY386_01695 [Candidatus Daviesbacteria bacterium]|nr:hypothetical protein [Candidatus Daviesbacteria bacterium]
MKKIIFIIFITFIFAPAVFALSKDDITFPVSELGGCKDEAECRAFCDKPENKMSPCFPFAKKYNLLTQEELNRAERFTQLATTGGPGWCRSDEGCSVEVFCNDYANLDQCLDFAEENNFATPNKLEKARKVAAGMKKKDAIAPPGNCRGENECEIYCSLEGNWQECTTWMNQIGIPLELSPEAQKFVDLLKQGKGAGGCRTKTDCENYCADPGHSKECLDMALAVGFITKDEAELAKKYGGTGPGGCKSESDCQAFCSQPYNQRVCLGFAQEHGIKVEFSGPGGCADVASCTSYCQANTSDSECQKQGGFKGPGGCTDQASCTAYCTNNQSDPECQKYSSQYGGFSGPGGCKDEASCTSYCKSNPKDSACAPYVGQYGGGVKGVSTTRGLLQLILDALF